MSNPYSAPNASFSDADYAVTETYEPRVFAWRGRIGRLRYLAYGVGLNLVFGLLLGVIVAVATGLNGKPSVMLSLISYVPLLIVAVCMAKRRLEDLDKNGWMAVLMLVPLANFFLGLYLLFGAGTPGPNRFGPAPSKNSRWVVFGACVVPLVAILGIVAAVAIPAYQDYQHKAKMQQLDDKL